MSINKSKRKQSRSHRRGKVATIPVATTQNATVGLTVPKPVTDVVTEKTYVTTESEVEVRKPATLAQALAEPEVVVTKPKTRVRKEVVSRTRRRA
jgi:hypothetical protein